MEEVKREVEVPDRGVVPRNDSSVSWRMVCKQNIDQRPYLWVHRSKGTDMGNMDKESSKGGKYDW